MLDTLEKAVVLAIIDQHWKEHLRDMDACGATCNTRALSKDRSSFTRLSLTVFPKMVQGQRPSGVVLDEVHHPDRSVGPTASSGPRPLRRLACRNRRPGFRTPPSKVPQPCRARKVSASTRRHRPRSHASATSPRPQPVAPIRTDKKIGRNEMVTIRQGSEVQAKFKKAEPLLSQVAP